MEIDDWVVKPRWDGKDIEKGVRDLDRLLSKLDKKGTRSSGKTSKSGKGAAREDPVVAATRLAKKKIQLESTVTKAMKSGLKNTSQYENMLKSKNLKNIDKATTDLRRKMSTAARKAEQTNTRAADKLTKERLAVKAKGDKAQLARGKVFHNNFKASVKLEDRRVSQQQKYLSNLRAISRELQRQSRSLGTGKGTEGARANLRSQRADVAVRRNAAMGAGFTLAGMGDLNNNLKFLRENSKLASREVRRLSKNLTHQQKLMNGMKDSVMNMARSYVSAFAIIAGVVATYRVGEQLDAVKASLMAVSGSVEGAAKDWEFIKKQSLGLGTDLQVMAKGYQQIAVAADTMGFSQEEAKNIFMASAESSKAFLLTTEDSAGVMRAFTQIMSKGTLSLEELKSQLGDRMPQWGH